MSLGLFKKISKSTASKQIHSYENIPAANVSSYGQTGKKKRQHRNHEADYINVQFDERNGRRYLATIGETSRQPKESSRDRSTGAIVSSTENTDGPMLHHEPAKRKRREIEKDSGSKSQRVYLRNSRIDSDSSSSDITDSSENTDAKRSELEHYNRLKLNLSCPPHNKKALKGIKILTDAKQQSLQLALHSSTLFKQRQQQSITEEPIGTSSAVEEEKKQSTSTIKYKKEGHINHVLSVTGRPIRHTPSVVASFSRSVGDVHGVHTNLQINSGRSFKGSVRMAGKRSNSVSDIETMRVTIHDSTQPSRASSLTRIQPSLTHHTDMRYKPGIRTNTDSNEPASHNACPVMCRCSDVPFIDAVDMITFNHNGGQYTSESHNIRITIPKGAIKKHTEADLQVGVALQGPFSFPDKKRPVSPIVWVGINPTTRLKKSIEITVPHFVKQSTQSNKKKLVFMKAAYRIKSIPRRKKYEEKYNFSEVAENNQQFNSDNYGTILTKDLCFFCIMGDVSSNSTLTPNYCLLPVIPKPVAQTTTWKIHYYVTYLLKSYIHMIRNQMGPEWEILPPRKFEFASLQGSTQEKIEIQFQRRLLDSGWIMSLETNDKISASDLDLWSDNGSKMEFLEPLGLYPPRFTIRVHSEEATTSSVAVIHFSGVTEVTMEIPLLKSRTSVSTTNPSTPTSVFSPTQPNTDTHYTSTCRQTSAHGLSGTSTCSCTECMQTLSDCNDYDHLTSMEELHVDQTNTQTVCF